MSKGAAIAAGRRARRDHRAGAGHQCARVFEHQHDHRARGVVSGARARSRLRAGSAAVAPEWTPTVARAESTFPEFDERLLTYVERARSSAIRCWICWPPIPLRSPREPRRNESRRRNLFSRSRPRRAQPARSAVADSGGSRIPRLWRVVTVGRASQRHRGVNFYDITVEPGNKLVRRKADQMVTASAHRISGSAGAPVRAISEHLEMGRSDDAAARERHRV